MTRMFVSRLARAPLSLLYIQVIQSSINQLVQPQIISLVISTNLFGKNEGRPITFSVSQKTQFPLAIIGNLNPAVTSCPGALNDLPTKSYLSVRFILRKISRPPIRHHTPAPTSTWNTSIKIFDEFYVTVSSLWWDSWMTLVELTVMTLLSPVFIYNKCLLLLWTIIHIRVYTLWKMTFNVHENCCTIILLS